MQSERTQGYGFALVAVMIWTGFILVSRQGGISTLHYTDIIAIRYSVCTLVLLPFWWFGSRFNVFRPRFLLAGSVGGLAYALCAFQGFSSAPASHAAVLLPGTMPLLILLLSVVINRERVIWTRWLGVAAISLGILCLGGAVFTESGAFLAGHGWLLLAAFFWSLFSVFIKRWGITPWEAVISLAFVTSLIYLPLYFWFETGQLANARVDDIVLQAVYQGILATIIQMFCYVNAVRLLGPGTMGSFMALVPLFAGLLSVWFFSEPLSVPLVIALLLVSAGCWLANTSGRAFKRRLNRRREPCPTST